MFKSFSPLAMVTVCGTAALSPQSALAEPRYSVPVYDSVGTQGPSFSSSITHILEDVSFAPGPYGPAFTEPRELTSLRFGYLVTGGVANTDFRFSFYRPSDLNWTGFAAPGSPVLNPSAVPYYVITGGGIDTNVCPGFSSYGYTIVFPTPLPIPPGETGVVLDLAAVKAGTPSSAPLDSSTLAGPTSTSRVAPLLARTSAITIGSSAPQTARDQNHDGVFSTSEVFFSVSNPVNLALALLGNINAPAAPTATDISAAIQSAVGNASYTGTLTPGSPVAWYKLSLPAGVSFDANTYLDIDTEGSAAPTGFALYMPNSTPFAYSESRGSGPDSPPSFNDLNAFQLSFGLPARPGVGNGTQYTGQEGDLPPGEYYIAVFLAPGGAGDAWAAGGTIPAAPVAYSLNFSTNLGNPSTLPPVLPPQIAWDFGIPFSSEVSTPFTVRARDVGWLRFALTNPIPLTGQFSQSTGNPLSDVTFLDITQPGSSITGEWNFALYNSSGFLANANSISYAGAGFNGNNGGGDGPYGCGGSFGQLSYGTEPSRGTAPVDPGLTTLGKPLHNQNGAALAADQYYLAVSMGNAHFKPSRFGARSTRGSSLTASITIASNNRTPGAGCPSDFNGDGGVDDTDFSFFAVAYNNLSDLVGDLNNDQLTDDADFSIFAAAYDALLCP